MIDRLIELKRAAFYSTGYMDGAVWNEEQIRLEIELSIVDDDCFINIIDDDYVIAYTSERMPSDFVVSIGHIKSSPKNSRELFSSVYEWAEFKGASHITIATTYGADSRLVSLFKRKGYEHVGYTFIKEL